MVTTFSRIAIRNLLRNKVYSIINIVSLSIGLAACLLVANVVIDDLSYDDQWEKASDIYRISQTDESTSQKTPVVLSGLGPALAKNFPEVENYCRISKGDKHFINSNKQNLDISCIITEPSFLSMFNFKFLQHSALTGKSGYKSVIITKEIKDKYFADINPVGKVITGFLLSGVTDSIPYVITGVIESIPYNSHLRAEAIVLKEFNDEDNYLSKFGVGYYCALYVLLKPGADTKRFSDKIDKLYGYLVEGGQYSKFGTQPLKEVYLYSDFARGDQKVIGSIRNVYIFSTVAIVLLLIACFNFINLTIARSLKRLSETGVRKVLGAGRLQLVLQFLSESLIFFVISFMLSVVFYHMSISGLETYLGHRLTVSFTQSLTLFISAIFVLLLICAFAGLYPALLLSGTKMALALKGVVYKNRGNSMVRKTLVVGQFAISIIIIIVAIVVKEQLFFLNHASIGYDKGNLLAINSTNFGTNGAAFKNEIKKIAGVENVTITDWSPGKGGGYMSIPNDDQHRKDITLAVWVINGDVDFVSTLKLKLQQGRLLSSTNTADVPNVNALYKSGNLDSLGKIFRRQSILLSAYSAKKIPGLELNKTSTSILGIPVGIVNDFHNESLRTIMKPVVIKGDNNISFGHVLIRVHPGLEKNVISSIGKIWRSFYSSQTMDYSWVADDLEFQYQAEKKSQELFFFFSYISIFLACMGLFGLVSFATEMRVKEIAIRKILGASVAIITTMISKDFLKLVVIAIVVAAPVALWLMHNWLEDYAYRIDISWWFVFTAGLITIIIALITVCFSSIKAAIANPVKSLRTE
jgi:putative ABC transport system permease protein